VFLGQPWIQDSSLYGFRQTEPNLWTRQDLLRSLDRTGG
jgi:hypothetical protein